MKLHRYVDHQRLHIVTKDVISLSISVLLLFRHYISHKITFGAPSSGGVLCSACSAFILQKIKLNTVKPILRGHSKRPKLGFQDQLSLNAAIMLQREHCAILSIFIKLPLVIIPAFS